MAWHRTGLAILANAALTLRAGVGSRHVMLVFVGGLLLLSALAVAVYGAMRNARLIENEQPPPARALLAVAIVSWIACAAGVAACLA